MINLYYWSNIKNAGDYFSCWLLNKMGIPFKTNKSANFGMSGSILAHSQLKNASIWGSGFHNETDKYLNNKIYAVRGKLSAKKINIPNIITGDPGILASKFYIPNVKKQYKFGIVSHYIDYSFFKNIKLPDNVLLINMETIDIEHVLNEINKCEFILSSSLHGIIFAHSYGIPAFHIKHNELASKNSFKFLDYYSNFNLKYYEKIIKNPSDLNFNEFNILYNNKNLFVPSNIEIINNQNNLLNVFPYKINEANKISTAICAIAKNENLYINDWCKWHLNLGFDKIYLYDNNDSKDKFIGDYIDDEIKEKVVIIPANDKIQFQKTAYNEFYEKYGKKIDWSAIIDIDEFIVLQEYNNIKTFLLTIPNNCNCIRLNWQIYGDDYGNASSDISIPVYDRITKKYNHSYNYHGKCFVKGGLKNVIFNSVHYPTINNTMPIQCLPSGKLLTDNSKINIGIIEYDVAYLSHYMTKTWEEFKQQKLNRTDAALDRHLKEDYYFIINPETKKKLCKN